MATLELLLELDLELSPMQKKPKSMKSTKVEGSRSSPAKNRRLSAEVRRARHRERKQRMRMAEKRSIEVKRVEVERLSRELEHAVKGLSAELKQRQGQGVETFPHDCDGDDWDSESTAAKIVQRRYLSLVLQQETITEENRRLTDKYHEWQKFTKLLGVEHERLPKLGAAYNLTSDLMLQDGEKEGRWVAFSDDEPVIFYEPIETKKCQELAFTGYQNLQEMLRGPGARTVHDEGFGWKVHFSIHGEGPIDARKLRVQHRFTKRINVIKPGGGRITADSLAAATWKIITTPELYSKMYHTPRASRVMQNVDANTCIMMRTYPDEYAQMRMRSVSLIVRVEDCVIDSSTDLLGLVWGNDTRRRVTILTNFLDPDQFFPRASTHTENPTAKWMREGTEYISFTEIDDEDCIDVEYGGLLNVGSDTTASTGVPLIVMGMGEALVRWEQLLPCTWRTDISK